MKTTLFEPQTGNGPQSFVDFLPGHFGFAVPTVLEENRHFANPPALALAVIQYLDQEGIAVGGDGLQRNGLQNRPAISAKARRGVIALESEQQAGKDIGAAAQRFAR